jgi:hypothetical protein
MRVAAVLIQVYCRGAVWNVVRPDQASGPDYVGHCTKMSNVPKVINSFHATHKLSHFGSLPLLCGFIWLLRSVKETSRASS